MPGRAGKIQDGRTVKTVYSIVNPLDNQEMSSSQDHNITASNVTVIRRQRLNGLLALFIREQVAQGQPHMGLERLFAEKLQVSPSLLSQLKKSRPISDKLARQIEAHCALAVGSLDVSSEAPATPTPAEEAFIALARERWREANAKGKRALLQALRSA